ncbi:MAG: acyl-CoA synthetase [Gemmatimonadetes bacterium]|nr:acyl-CoA synthetase [Gemmatimonadota bacterium]
MAELPLIHRARVHADRICIRAGGTTFAYDELLSASARVASALLGDRRDLEERRVGFLVPPGFEHVAVQWGIWRAGGVAVPLAPSHPKRELRHTMRDAGASVVVVHPGYADAGQVLADGADGRLLPTPDALATEPGALPEVDETRRAMIVYTSGTTGNPKGVVTTHASLEAQVTSLITAWEWTADDRVLLALPLHHIHGIVNVLTCALWSGARCDILARFDAQVVWDRITSGALTLFMAVPTIYRKLIAAWDAASTDRQPAMSAACRGLRLMVSGSAALPVSVFERWRDITGHALLERYGMTEIGMGLSAPLHGERVPGSVGTPLPGVEARLVDGDGVAVTPGRPGEIEIRGPGVFLEYWGRPEETAGAFHDGWFRTGDIGVLDHGRYRIVGRQSVDIINTGGFNVSALEIEEVLRMHPAIDECAVVGVPDSDLGERVCAAVELRPGHRLTLEGLRVWAKQHLAVYKIPRELCPTVLPRNAMGKIMKRSISPMFGPGDDDGDVDS